MTRYKTILVPTKPVPCKVTKPPEDFPVGVLTEGCPEGFLCITDDSAAMTGLFIRDAKRTFKDLRACPNVTLDETFGTALDRWMKEKQSQ